MGTFLPGFVPGSKFLCQPGTFSVFFVPKLCLVGTFLPGFVPGSKFLCQPGTFSVFFVPKWCLVGTFLSGFVPGKCISCVLGPFQSGFVFRAVTVGRQMQIYVGKVVGMVLKKKMLRQVFLFLDFAVFRKSNLVNLPFIGKALGWILFVTNISECVRF